MVLGPQVAYESPQSQIITMDTKAANLPNSNGGNVGMVAKGLPLVNITEMNFDRWQCHCCDRISDGYTCVSIGSGIY